jgi:hypothetical protein
MITPTFPGNLSVYGEQFARPDRTLYTANNSGTGGLPERSRDCRPGGAQLDGRRENRSGVNEVAIQLYGHGYKGMIAVLANFPGSGVTIAGLGHKNVTNITLERK